MSRSALRKPFLSLPHVTEVDMLVSDAIHVSEVHRSILLKEDVFEPNLKPCREGYFSVQVLIPLAHPVVAPPRRTPGMSFLGNNWIYRMYLTCRKIAFDERDTLGNISKSFGKAFHDKRLAFSDLQPSWRGRPDARVVDTSLVGKLPYRVTLQYIENPR
jgi:hypothetical protein